MKKIISLMLSVIMLLSLCSVTAFAADSTVTLSLNNGDIDITETGYTQNDVTTPFTGKYIITGSRTSDTPLDISNNSKNHVTFDITLQNAFIKGDTWCTAVRITGTGSITLNITNIGTSTIRGYGHAALEVQADLDLDICIENETGANLTLANGYNNPQVYGSTGVNPTVTIDGTLVEGSGNPHTSHRLSKVLHKEATESQDGNIEFYRCTVCGLCFLDESGTKSIAKADTKLISGRDTSVKYDVDPTYTVTIPATVTLGETATIKAENVVVEENKQVTVKIAGTSGTDNAFTLSNGKTATIPYTVTNGDTTYAINDTVLAVNSAVADNGETTLKFNPPESVTYSGDYTGHITFTIAIEEVQP